MLPVVYTYLDYCKRHRKPQPGCIFQCFTQTSDGYDNIKMCMSFWNALRLIKSRDDKMEEPGVDGKIILKLVLTEIENLGTRVV